MYSNRAPLPDEDIIFKLENENVWTTSVFSENKKVKCRFFECNGKKKKIKLTKKRGISISEIKDIYGKKMKMLSPFRISEMSISDC